MLYKGKLTSNKYSQEMVSILTLVGETQNYEIISISGISYDICRAVELWDRLLCKS